MVEILEFSEIKTQRGTIKKSSSSKRSKKVEMKVCGHARIYPFFNEKCWLKTPPHHLVLPYVRHFHNSSHQPAAVRGSIRGFEDTENQEKISSRLGSVLGKAAGEGGGSTFFLFFLHEDF